MHNNLVINYFDVYILYEKYMELYNLSFEYTKYLSFWDKKQIMFYKSMLLDFGICFLDFGFFAPLK